MKKIISILALSLCIVPLAFANTGNSSSTDEWIAIALLLVVALFALGVSVGFYVLVAVLAKNRHRNV